MYKLGMDWRLLSLLEVIKGEKNLIKDKEGSVCRLRLLILEIKSNLFLIRHIRHIRILLIHRKSKDNSKN